MTFVAFSPDGRFLASASWDKTIKLWDPHTGEHLRTLEGHSSEVTFVTFSPDGGPLASASWDKTIKLWDPFTGEHLRTLEGHSSEVTSMAFSTDGGALTSVSDDNTIIARDLHTTKHPCHAPSWLDPGEPSHMHIHLTTDCDMTQLNASPRVGNAEYSPTWTSLGRQGWLIDSAHTIFIHLAYNTL